VDKRLVANIDIAPTVLDAAELDGGAQMDGRSLLEPFNRDRLLLEMPQWGSPSGPEWASLVTSRRQYVEYYDQNHRLTFRELYNLKRDPHQMRNLLWIGEHRTKPAPRWSSRLHADQACAGASCP
jgi:arylsulfatase A-like enzyme